jgi:AraC-like DNA-binding protein
VDVLTDLLERSRARGAAFARTAARGGWGLAFPTSPGLAVHVVVDGELSLWTGDAPDAEIRLRGGELALVRGDVLHRIGDHLGAECRDLADVLAEGVDPTTARLVRVGDADGAPTADFFCGAYLFEGDLCDGLLQLLPDTLVVRPAMGSPLRASLELMAVELLRDEPGQQSLLDRLLDVALIQILREHFQEREVDAPAWFRGMADPPVAAALRAMHEDPAHPWTVGELAGDVGLSRAAFARRFTDVVGQAPLTYLTDWRMALAREQLRGSADGLAAVAAAVGYTSEFAFAAAFKRHHGMPPGRWRTAAPHAEGATSTASATG